jgi:hypothetical protein
MKNFLKGLQNGRSINMPMTKWSGSSKDMITVEGNMFLVRKKVAYVVNGHIYKWTSEISDFRLLQILKQIKKNNK